MTARDVLVMAKAPVAGRVKTRLCPPCSHDDAASVAAAALHDTLMAALACSATRVVLALDGEPGDWVPRGVHVVAQGSGTLNARLCEAWWHLPNGGVQIGMDTPQVTPALLDRALRLVDRSRAALGLATDGGWWLIGLARPQRGAFDGVPMSTANAGARQRERLLQLGLRPAMLPPLTDIDTWPSARDVAASIPWSRTAAAVNDVMRRIASVA